MSKKTQAKQGKASDLAIALGGAIVCLKEIYDCPLLAEAKDVVDEYDKRTLALAIARAKTAKAYGLETALRDALRLISALLYLQGDDQFRQYKESVDPVLKTLEDKR